MRKVFMMALTALLFGAACNAPSPKGEKENVLLEEFKTPFGVPPFADIQIADYLPALEMAIDEKIAEIEAITSNTAAPTFDNTIVPLDRSGKSLARISSVLFCLNSAETSPEMQAVVREVRPKLTDLGNKISLNEALFQRIKTVYNANQESSDLDAEQQRVLEKYYKDFERGGANLSPDKKAELEEINLKLSSFYTKFSENILYETNSFQLFVSEDQLAGLPSSVVQGAADAAKNADKEGKYLFTIQKPSMLPFLQYADNRGLREELYTAYFMRGNNGNEYDNKEVINEIVNLRLMKAKVLGFDDFASYKLAVNMATTTDNAYQLLDDLWESALAMSKEELKAMQAVVDEEGGDFKIEPWDWWYYTEKVRKAQFNLDEEELKPYFSLESVRSGVFDLSERLYGITFKQQENLPVYNEDVEAWEVSNPDGSHLGIVYLDFHPRPGKRVGAWCTGFRSGGYDEQGERINPIVSIVCNFTPPTGGMPSLLTLDETETLFHEFGHGLHGLFSDGNYKRVSGDMPRDMIELPSQIMENWAASPIFMKEYAKHYKTGEIIPDALIEKMDAARHFNQGFITVEYLAASYLDFDWSSITENKNFDVVDFEKKAMDKIGLIPEILPRYRSTYFNHVFSGDGYSAGYYVYIWAAVLDADAYNAFVESGDLYNKEIAAAFREYILAGSGKGEGMVQYKKFRGTDPNPDYLKRKRGFIE